ncbi:MAG: amidohydrolase family protein [Veillonellales bacterium]
MDASLLSRRSFIARTGGALVGLYGLDMSEAALAFENESIEVPFSSGTDYPAFKVPANACDCHHHIYDSRFPIDPKAALRPPDATVADYRLLQKRLGTTRHVIVQPSTYGIDNRCLVEALKEFGLETTRGIAVVNSDVTDEQLEGLHQAGVRGIRFNFSVPGEATSWDMLKGLSDRIEPLGWHIQVVAKAEQIFENRAVWPEIKCPIVFDHLGHIPSISHPAFGVLEELLREGNTWIKLSGVYILSKVGAPSYSDRKEVFVSYVATAPERLVWGSDWPHPTSSLTNKPNDANLLNLLFEWVPDEAVRNRILVTNPEKLYGF